MNLDLSEFEFTVDLTCEMKHHREPVKAIRYMVQSCPRCLHGDTKPVCGNCYVSALRYRSTAMARDLLVGCLQCGTPTIPMLFTQFYELRHFEILSHRETEREES